MSKRSLRIGLQVALVVAAAEVLFRVAFPEQLRTESYPLIYRPDPVVGYRYQPGAKGRLCIPGICKEFIINENGYYGPSFEMEKQPGLYRIAFVGDSQWSGIWLDADEDFAMKLQRRFDEEGRSVEILNFSVDGARRGIQTLRLVYRDVVRYRPDLAVVAVGIPLEDSDVQRDVYRGYVLVYGGSVPGLDEEPKRIVDRIHEARALTWLYDVSYTVRAACRFYLLHLNPDGTSTAHMMLRGYVHKVADGWIDIQQLTMHRSLAEIAFVRRTLARQGARTLMVIANEQLGPVLRARGIDPMPIVLGDDPGLRHHLDAHLSERGHEALAEAIYSFLIAQPWFPAAAGGPDSDGPLSSSPRRRRSMPPAPASAELREPLRQDPARQRGRDGSRRSARR